MKFIHLSDLHIGKRVNGFSMLEDQKYILDQILMIAEEEMPDGVLIAGDIYDKPVPPAEAVQVFDAFLTGLADRNLPTIFFNLILQIINGFRVFTESYVITDGGPLDSTLSYVLYLYRRAFTYFDMGYSCALAWILVAIIAVFTVMIFKTQKNWVYYESEEG